MVAIGKPDETRAIGAAGRVADVGNATVVVLVDDRAGERLGTRAPLRGTRIDAEARRRWSASARRPEPRRRYETGDTHGTSLRHGRGGRFISHVSQDQLGTVGIKSSPFLIRQPESDSFVERIIRDPRRQILRPRRLATVAGPDRALRDFANCFNKHRIIGQICERAPAAHRCILPRRGRPNPTLNLSWRPESVPSCRKARRRSRRFAQSGLHGEARPASS